MSVSDAYKHGILGGPPKADTPGSEPLRHSDKLVFGHDAERCPVTKRIYEQGITALPHEQQTANFIREAQILADMPKPGERCRQTNREYESGSGALPKSMQTANFLEELPPELKAQRQAEFEELRDVETVGRA